MHIRGEKAELTLMMNCLVERWVVEERGIEIDALEVRLLVAAG